MADATSGVNARTHSDVFADSMARSSRGFYAQPGIAALAHGVASTSTFDGEDIPAVSFAAYMAGRNAVIISSIRINPIAHAMAE